MSTSQPETKCDKAVFDKGQLVFRLAGLPSTAIEALVVRLRETTKIRVDWHFAGGIAQVLVLGSEKDRAEVRRYFEELEIQKWPVSEVEAA